MIFKKTGIEGCFIIEPKTFVDNRGVFRRHFDADEFKKHGIVSEVKQCNISENFVQYMLRGFHYQLPPHSEGKTLSCVKGSIYDIVVDLRSDSKTFLKWQSFELNDENRASLHIPPGCTHAFLTLDNETLVHYYCSENYNPEAERGIRYNDSFFKFKWPHEPEIISEKDSSWPDFSVERINNEWKRRMKL